MARLPSSSTLVASAPVSMRRLGRRRAGSKNARAVAARLVMLGFLEIGQHSFVRPAAVTELGPGVVVERIAAHYNMPLIELDPPRVLPRGTGIVRPWRFGSGSVANRQL